MSADNYIVTRYLDDGHRRVGWYWAMGSASDPERRLDDRDFHWGPFATRERAITHAYEELSVIEYGVWEDPPPGGTDDEEGE